MSELVGGGTAEALSAEEAERLQNLEEVISRGRVASFFEVGNALAEIHNRKLYRATHGTFEDYCKARLQMSRYYAYRLIAATKVARNVLPTGNIPTSERQLRPLLSLPPDQQQTAWKTAVAKSKDGNPTAIEVEQAVQTLNGRHTIKLFEVTAKMPLQALLLDLGSAYADDACSLIQERAQSAEERQAAISLLLSDSERISDLVRSHFSSKTETDPDATEPVS